MTIRTAPYQDTGSAVVQTIAKRIRYNTPRPVVLGGLPAGAVLLGGSVHTLTPFDAGGGLSIGLRDDTASDPDAYGSGLSLGEIGRVELENLGESATPLSRPTTVIADFPDMEGQESESTASKGEVVVTLNFVVAR